jgi:hypothetical protein
MRHQQGNGSGSCTTPNDWGAAQEPVRHCMITADLVMTCMITAGDGMGEPTPYGREVNCFSEPYAVPAEFCATAR